jgi:hypothetical protein
MVCKRLDDNLISTTLVPASFFLKLRVGGRQLLDCQGQTPAEKAPVVPTIRSRHYQTPRTLGNGNKCCPPEYVPSLTQISIRILALSAQEDMSVL